MATRRFVFPTRLNPLHSGLASLDEFFKRFSPFDHYQPRLISLPWFPPLPNPSSASEWVYKGFYSIFMFMAIYRLSLLLVVVCRVLPPTGTGSESKFREYKTLNIFSSPLVLKIWLPYRRSAVLHAVTQRERGSFANGKCERVHSKITF